MAFQEQVIDFKGHDSAETGRSFTYKTQRVGTGDDAGASFPAVRASLVPGVLADPRDVTSAYSRTDISATSGVPLEIRDIAGMCWTEDVYTAHEAKLRA